MARVPGNPTAASLGQTTMTRTIYCPQCGVTLNVPESAAGRKLRCPKCATKFAAPSAASPGDSVIAEPSPTSSMFPTQKGPASSGDFGPPTRRGSSGSVELPTSGQRAGHGDFDMPTTSSAPLRETFDIPLLGEDFPPVAPSKAKTPEAADALALFQDEPKANRKLKGAEARSRSRRCPSCGGLVGIGMSLCNVCGLDLDTGQRIAAMEVLEDEMPEAPRSDTPSLGVMFVGGLTIMVNILMSVISVVAWAKGNGPGVLMLLVIWLFGIYASVQFLRRKAIRPLFLSLALGVGIGAVYLIALPIWKVNMGTDVVVTSPEGFAPTPVDPIDPEVPAVKNLAEDLDMTRVSWGIFLLLTYAGLSVFLNSPTMRREFTKK